MPCATTEPEQATVRDPNSRERRRVAYPRRDEDPNWDPGGSRDRAGATYEDAHRSTSFWIITITIDKTRETVSTVPTRQVTGGDGVVRRTQKLPNRPHLPSPRRRTSSPASSGIPAGRGRAKARVASRDSRHSRRGSVRINRTQSKPRGISPLPPRSAIAGAGVRTSRRASSS